MAAIDGEGQNGGRYQERAERGLDADGGPLLPDEAEVPGRGADHGGDHRAERVRRRLRRQRGPALPGPGPRRRGRRAPPQPGPLAALGPRRLLRTLQAHDRLDPLPRLPHCRRRCKTRGTARSSASQGRSFRLGPRRSERSGRRRGEEGASGTRQNGRKEMVGVVGEVAVVLFCHDEAKGRKPFAGRGDSNFERRRAATGKGCVRAAKPAGLSLACGVGTSGPACHPQLRGQRPWSTGSLAFPALGCEKGRVLGRWARDAWCCRVVLVVGPPEIRPTCQGSIMPLRLERVAATRGWLVTCFLVWRAGDGVDTKRRRSQGKS